MNTGSTVGVRKIVCFFVCDPENRIVSTKHTHEQNWDKISFSLRRALLDVAGLSGDVVGLVLEYAKWGMTLKEAHEVTTASC